MNFRTFKEKYGPWGLIAGASEGIGAAFAEALAKKGINLLLLARRKEKLEDLAAILREKHSVEVRAYGIDLTEQEAVSSLLSEIGEELGMLVYNAAYSPIGYFKDVSSEDLQQVVSVNVRTPLLLVKWASQGMIRRKKGGIILMSSLSGGQGSPKIATYAATKSFNTILAEGLWHELKTEGVDVLACTAGAVRTPGYMSSMDQKDAPGTLNPEEVVEQALNALGSQPVATPGKVNKIAQFVMGRLLPRKMRISIMHNNTKDLNPNT